MISGSGLEEEWVINKKAFLLLTIETSHRIVYTFPVGLFYVQLCRSDHGQLTSGV